MPRRRQLVLIRLEDPDDRLSANVPLGRLEEFEAVVGRFNTASDGSPPTSIGTRLYHGPGIVIEVAGDKEIKQALVTCIEEDLAWPVLRGICREGGWKMQDLESGRMFG